MSHEEIEAKALGFIAPVLGSRAAQQLVATIGTLENVANVAALRPLLQG
jgi:Tfp pilus assembly protein FimV